MSTFALKHGDCLDKLKEIPDNSIDSIVTDPPYGISFMGKKWDHSVPNKEIWEECLRVLKPGGHLLAFAGTRTQHRMAVAIEDAGFEVRDIIAWVYASGMPKSHNIGKAIDKTLGAEREKIGKVSLPGYGKMHVEHGVQTRNVTEFDITSDEAVTEEAKEWNGWGTAVKPSFEPITVARKPLGEKTIAANVLKWGTGGLNIDDCRIPANSKHDDPRMNGNGSRKTEKAAKNVYSGSYAGDTVVSSPKGRFPANLIHDGSQEVLELFPDAKSGGSVSGNEPSHTGDENTNCYGEYGRVSWDSYTDSGSAARFFYCAKASKKDRNEGMPESKKNNHPTLKPTKLMQYLCKLITPTNGTILDPFMGSGSTGKAAMIEGFDFIGIELEKEYLDIAKSRIQYACDVLTKQNVDNIETKTTKKKKTEQKTLNDQFFDYGDDE